MISCPDRTPSYDPVSLIPNGFCYTFECNDPADIANLPLPTSGSNLRAGSTALLYQVGQDIKMYKLFDTWEGPY